MSEEELVKRIAENDREAFEDVFRIYYSDLSKYCNKYVRSEVIAEEIVQEVFINIWERRNSISISTSVKAYLFAAVRNRAFNYIKLQLPKEHSKVDLDNVAYMVTDDGINESLEELKRHVALAIETLPNKCKIVFNLSRNAGMTYKEIAEELGVSVKTVENQVGLALRKLREQLNPIWDKIMMIILLFFL